MKINTISHKNTQKERLNDIPRSRNNKDRKYHPFAQEREYVKALNAVKIERLLAKPFVSALTYHKEGITCIAKNHYSDIFSSASFNGQVFVWDLRTRNWVSEIQIKSTSCGLAFGSCGLFVGEDNTISYYGHPYKEIAKRYGTNGHINSLDFFQDLVACTTQGIEVLDINKGAQKAKYGVGNTFSSSFSTKMDNILGFCEGKSLVLADHRIGQEFLRVTVGIKSNCLQFSPRYGQIVASGNEDNSLYIHDIRYIDKPLVTFSQHVNAICSLDFNSSGTQVATGSYDQTIRIFDVEERVCKDVYYNKRMHNVNGVKYSTNSEFIITGSDDGNLRIWKSDASRKLGPLSRREKENYNLSDALKSKFKDVGEIKRIKNHRFLPKHLKNKIKNSVAQRKAQDKKNSRTRRDD